MSRAQLYCAVLVFVLRAVPASRSYERLEFVDKALTPDNSGGGGVGEFLINYVDTQPSCIPYVTAAAHVHESDGVRAFPDAGQCGSWARGVTAAAGCV